MSNKKLSWLLRDPKTTLTGIDDKALGIEGQIPQSSSNQDVSAEKTEVCSSECTADLSLAGLVNPSPSDAPPQSSQADARFEARGRAGGKSRGRRGIRVLRRELKICKFAKCAKFPNLANLAENEPSKNSQNVLINVTQFYPILQNLANLHVWLRQARGIQQSHVPARS